MKSKIAYVNVPNKPPYNKAERRRALSVLLVSILGNTNTITPIAIAV